MWFLKPESLGLLSPRHTVQLGTSVEVSRVGTENHAAGFVGNGHHLIVDSLKVEICHDCCDPSWAVGNPYV